MTDKRLTNNLRAELYKHLFPQIIAEDHADGVESYVNFWDDPLLKWDEGHLWDELGVVPVLKNFFYAIEEEETRDLEMIDSITDLIDPDKCPAAFLDVMARSLGHPLEEDLTEAEQREVIKSIITLNKARGTELSWEVFYRMIGWTIKAIPLWKKKIFEDNDDYSQERYVTSIIEGELIGTSGSKFYDGTFANAPIEPGTIRIKVDGMVFRDDDNKFGNTYAQLVAQDGSIGNFNYATGEYHIELENVSSTDVEADYELITDEFPYKAARVDLEFYIFLQDESETHIFDQDILDRLLSRLEEVRPIHVLTRLIVLVLDAPDNIPDFANDETVCGPRMGKDVRSDDYRFYAADVGLAVQGTDFIVEKDFGATKDIEKQIEERIHICPTRDTLTIEFSDATPTQYW